MKQWILNFAIPSLIIGITLLALNWMAAFGWVFIINTIILGLLAIFLEPRMVKYKFPVVLLAFLMSLLPVFIIVFSANNIIDSIDTTKENLNDLFSNESGSNITNASAETIKPKEASEINTGINISVRGYNLEDARRKGIQRMYDEEEFK